MCFWCRRIVVLVVLAILTLLVAQTPLLGLELDRAIARDVAHHRRQERGESHAAVRLAKRLAEQRPLRGWQRVHLVAHLVAQLERQRAAFADGAAADLAANKLPQHMPPPDDDPCNGAPESGADTPVRFAWEAVGNIAEPNLALAQHGGTEGRPESSV